MSIVGLKVVLSMGAKYLVPAHTEILSENVDWTENRAVTAVKNQGQCGYSWAFLTNRALEAMHHPASEKLVSFSEQSLVNCIESWDRLNFIKISQANN